MKKVKCRGCGKQIDYDEYSDKDWQLCDKCWQRYDESWEFEGDGDE